MRILEKVAVCKRFFTPIFIILYGISLFLYGSVVVYQQEKREVVVVFADTAPQNPAIAVENGPAEPQKKGPIVASKNGSKYYFLWCVSSRIKEENKVYFETENEAKNKGFERSQTCK